MSENLPILVRNTCYGLTDGAQKLYLDLIDKHQGWNDPEGESRAFLTAHQYDRQVGTTLDHIFRNAPIERGPHLAELSRFIADRWKNNFMEQA